MKPKRFNFIKQLFIFSLKPIIDKLSAITILLLFFPVLLIISICLSISNKGNPFFFQLRPGKNEKIFKLIKFKTMNDKRDSKGVLLSDEKRLTQIGRFIRKTSLDELPQLVNVLKGDMSIVGPRPLLVQYLPLYNEKQKRRHDVKPGITGWAQVNGRNAISWRKKFELDIEYVNNTNFILDVKILILTLKKVVFAEDITNGVEATTEAFNGNN